MFFSHSSVFLCKKSSFWKTIRHSSILPVLRIRRKLVRRVGIRVRVVQRPHAWCGTVKRRPGRVSSQPVQANRVQATAFRTSGETFCAEVSFVAHCASGCGFNDEVRYLVEFDGLRLIDVANAPGVELTRRLVCAATGVVRRGADDAKRNGLKTPRGILTTAAPPRFGPFSERSSTRGRGFVFPLELRAFGRKAGQRG